MLNRNYAKKYNVIYLKCIKCNKKRDGISNPSL